MKLTPLQKRAERRSRHQNGLDMNLVALIDVFTILIFFLLSGASGVEVLPSHKSVKLPQSVAETSPRETVVVVVSACGDPGRRPAGGQGVRCAGHEG